MHPQALLPRIDAQNMSAPAYRILRESIVSKEFAPGQRLDLDLIGTQMGISRTPLREALARLEMEGLVTVIPRSGTYVSNPGAQDIADSFDVRQAIELASIESAVSRATEEDLQSLGAIVERLSQLTTLENRDAVYPEYLALDHELHRRLVALSGNRRLSEAHDRENVHAQMARVRFRRSERDWDLAQKEHENIFAALKARNAAKARSELKAHLDRAKRSLLQDMKTAK